MDTKLNYQGVVERIKAIALAHPQVNSADDGRELEFDVAKTSLWPRVFIRTDGSGILGGQGTAEPYVTFSILVMDRLNTDRSNMIDAMNITHSIMLAFLATMNKEQLIRYETSPTMSPLYDYQDTQSAGWTVTVRVYLDVALLCYPV